MNKGEALFGCAAVAVLYGGLCQAATAEQPLPIAAALEVVSSVHPLSEVAISPDGKRVVHVNVVTGKRIAYIGGIMSDQGSTGGHVYVTIRAGATPALIVGGNRDAEVPITQSYEYWNALRRHGVKTEFVVYPDEGTISSNAPTSSTSHRVSLSGSTDTWRRTDRSAPPRRCCPLFQQRVILG